MRDRLRELAPMLARREAAGDAAGFDRLRAEREVLDVDSDRRERGDRARHGAGDLAGLSRKAPIQPRGSSQRRTTPRMAAPAIDELMARAEADARRADGPPSRDRRRASSPARRGSSPRARARGDRGTKSSTVGGDDVGSVVIGPCHRNPLFDPGRPPERASRDARAAQAETGAAALRARCDEARSQRGVNR